MRVACNRDFAFDRISVRIAEETKNGYSVWTSPATMEIPKGGVVPESFHLDERGSQDMMNELWRLGVRPTDGSGSTGHIGALNGQIEKQHKYIECLFDELSRRQ